jgi:hypothetical protein
MYCFKKSLATLAGRLALAAILAALLPLSGLGQEDVKKPLKRDARHSFYLTKTTHTGAQALAACAEGYHMASLWEILDPSNLRYDTEHGVVDDDSGFGPPSSTGGWVRTGYRSHPSHDIGRANCSAWTSASSGDAGSAVGLDPSWDSTFVTPIGPWAALSLSCNVPIKVWCVQD